MKKLREQIGANLKRFRKAKKINQTDMAKYFQVAQTTISMWENGEAMMTADVFIKIADYLEVSADELAGRTHFMSADDRLLIRKYHAVTQSDQELIDSVIDTAYERVKKTEEQSSAS